MYDLHMVKAVERWVITGMHLCHGYAAKLEQSPRPAPGEMPDQVSDEHS